MRAVRPGDAARRSDLAGVRFLLRHLSGGALAAVVFEGLLLGSDAFGLRTLVMASEQGLPAAGLLLFGLTVTFGSAAMGAAIMTLDRNSDDASGTKAKTWLSWILDSCTHKY